MIDIQKCNTDFFLICYKELRVEYWPAQMPIKSQYCVLVYFWGTLEKRETF